jgi:hypothetical protein
MYRSQTGQFVLFCWKSAPWLFGDGRNNPVPDRTFWSHTNVPIYLRSDAMKNDEKSGVEDSAAAAHENLVAEFWMKKLAADPVKVDQNEQRPKEN